MNTEPKPFTIQTMLVLQGGHIKKSMLLPCDYVENTPFLSLKKSNRQLASAMGKPCHTGKWSPLTACDVFEKMQQLRNDKVDKLIKAKMVSDDPFADAREFKIQASQRHRLFMDCKVPEIIEIELPQFVTAAGKHVGEKQLKIISTWNKLMSPCVEATGPNMDWLLLACQHEGWLEKPTSPKRKDIGDDIELPTLPEPLKYKISTDGAVKIYVYYKSDKKWCRMEKKLDTDTFDDDAIEDKEQLIIAAAAKMLKVYHERHNNDNVKDGEASAQGEVKGEVQSDSDVDDNKLDAAGEGSAGSTGG
jgi:hypothetical protein